MLIRPKAGRGFYVKLKPVLDFIGALLLLPTLVLVAVVLAVINPLLNPGPLFFVQDRMGQGGRPFAAWKFRSMRPATDIKRGPFDALEQHRIPPIGGLLRRSRLDELPQIINVLRGEMSLIGPRPDYLDHAEIYVDEVPGYGNRHSVRPGISGYAQVVHGYVDGLEGVQQKVDADLYYIRHLSLKLDLWVFWRTVMIVLLHRGR